MEMCQRLNEEIKKLLSSSDEPMYQYAAARIEDLERKLAEYNEAAKEYGIDAKTMLELAKSQLLTASQNVALQDELNEYRKKEADRRLVEVEE